jgi:colanic acid biosynthesis glycosyl transferase WcaI
VKLIFLNRFFYPDLSATAQMLADLAFHLAARGYQVEVITGRHGYLEHTAPLPKRGVERGVTVHRVWSTRYGYRSLAGKLADYLFFSVSSLFRLLRSARKGDLVIALTDPPMSSLGVSLVAKLRRCRQVNWLQDLFPEIAAASGIGGMQGVAGRWLQGLRNRSLQRADLNVVLGETMRGYLQQQGTPPERLRVIHNWADGQLIQPQRDGDNSLRGEWGLQGKFVIGYAGNLGRAHEIATVLDAAAALQDEHDICFLFVGGGSLQEELRQQVEAQGMHNVVFRDYQPRELLGQALAAADVHLTILRPELEGLIVPCKIYGILAAGITSVYIGDTHGEIAHMLQEAKAGEAVEAGDAASLVERIRYFRAHPARLAAMGSNARALFEARYAAQRAFMQWESVFNRLVPQGVEARTPVELRATSSNDK